MNDTELMALFEKVCATWGFDLSTDDSGPNGLIYSSYETGLMFGMFSRGVAAAEEHYGVGK